MIFFYTSPKKAFSLIYPNSFYFSNWPSQKIYKLFRVKLTDEYYKMANGSYLEKKLTESWDLLTHLLGTPKYLTTREYEVSNFNFYKLGCI